MIRFFQQFREALVSLSLTGVFAGKGLSFGIDTRLQN